MTVLLTYPEPHRRLPAQHNEQSLDADFCPGGHTSTAAIDVWTGTYMFQI
jgi:hypothetical protein